MKSSNNNASNVPLKDNIKQNKFKKNDKIEEILKKENNRSIKSKRKDILTQQLINKLGRKKLDKINKYVDQYLETNIEINSNTIEILEKLIMEDQNHSQIQIPESSTVVSNSNLTTDKIQMNEQNHGNNNNSNNNENNNIPPLPPGNEWKKLTILQGLQDENYQVNNNIHKIKKTQSLSNALLKQIRYEHERKLKEKEENLEYGERVKKEAENFLRESENEKIKHIELNKKTKLMWDDQLSFLTKQKEMEKEKEIFEKQKKLQQIQKETELIENENLKRKTLEEKRVELIKKEYEDKKKEKEYLRLKEKEDDRKMAIENQKQYEREENERKRQFQARLMKIENRIQLAEDGPIRISQEEEMRENDIILKHIRERNELENKLEEEKKKNYIKKLKEINETNSKLMNDKYNRLNEERLLERKMGEQSRRLGQEVLEEIRLSFDKKKFQQQQYRNELLKQIEEQSYQKIVLQRDMNKIEKSLNSKDLQKLENDPNTARKVAELFVKSSPRRN